MINVKINGNKENVKKGSTVSAILEQKSVQSEMVAVELNGDLIAREEYDQKTLAEGDILEFLYYMAGGEKIKIGLQQKYIKLKNYLKSLGSVVVAFSGGVDSTLLLKTALDELGKDKVLTVIGRSETYPAKEVTAASKLAEKLKARYRIVDTKELANDIFRANSIDRCFYCKDELFSKLEKIAKDNGYKHIVDGSNAEDTNDFRPGRQAAQKLKVLSPLQECGLKKEEIRMLSKKMGLENWNKPSLACLASRFPYGQTIDSKKLNKVERAEAFLHDLGISQVRVRLDENTARIEVLPAEFNLVIKNSLAVTDCFKKLGFVYIALDLEGYKSGSMNKVLSRLRGVSHA